MINIDYMTSDHIDGVLEVECECFSSPWSKEAFLGDLENEHTVYLIAKDREKVIGYAGVWCVAGDADITNIAVSADWRGKGVGKLLLERLIFEAKQTKSENIRLEVRKSNKTAISLYEKFGFSKVYEREKYYDNEEDALILEKKIN